MKDQAKIKKQLMEELASLRQRIAELEASETYSRQAKEMLLESEAGLRAIIERSPDGIYLGDIETKRILLANRAFQELLSYSAEGLVGTHIYDIIAADPKDIDDRFQKVLSLRGMVPFDHERKYRRKDGSLGDVWVRGTTLTYGGKEVMCTFVRDMTERKRAEEALRESEEKYRTLFEESRDVIYINTPEGKFVDVNSAGLELFGYSKEEMMALNVRELYANPDDRRRFQREIEREGSVRDYEIRLRKKDGTEMDCLVTAILRRGSEGGTLQYQGIIRDVTQRKRMEQEVRQSEERYRAVVEQSADAICLVNVETKRLLEVNTAFQKMLGYSPEKLVGMSLYDFIAADPEDIDQRFQRIRTEKQLPFIERQFRRKDGSLLPVWVSAFVTFYGGKEVVCAIARDLSAHKQAEHVLRQSEERYRAIMEQSAEGIFLEDVEARRLLEANAAFQELMGYGPEDIRGLSIYDIVSAPREDMDGRLQEILSSQVPYTHERQYRRKDGSLIDVWLSSKVITIAGKKVLCTLVHDITADKQAEQALRESEERYRAIMEQSAEGIFLVDVQTRRIVEANIAFQELLGYPSEEVRGLSIYDFVAANRQILDTTFEAILKAERPLSYERKYRRKDGSLIDVWLSSKVITYGGKQVISVLVRDLTEKKALESQLLRAQRMECIGLLAGGIAHDLNNILSPILMNVELLQHKIRDRSSQKTLSSIASCVQRGSNIVRQILAFSRGTEGELLPLFPKLLLKEMEQLLEETFPKSIQIETKIPKDLWPLCGDPTQLHQMLMNLCLNAKAAMPKGGILSLSAQNVTLDETYAAMDPSAKPGHFVRFSISDTGIGIPPENLSRIFDPFFTTKERGEGTGLGLATVQGIVKGHGGFIRVESEVGKGTSFEVYLPASPSAEMAQVEEEKPSLPSGKGELILVVEDEATLREIFEATLEAYGYRVTTASDGAEAVAVYARHPGEIQAVLADMAMPIMDGPATIRALEKIDPYVRVIAISGLDVDRLMGETSLPAVKALLQKPFTVDRLLQALAEVLKKE